MLVFSTIAASSEWHQGQTKGKRHGWLRDHGCERRVGTVRNIQHFSWDELNDLDFFYRNVNLLGMLEDWEWDPGLFIRWDEG